MKHFLAASSLAFDASVVIDDFGPLLPIEALEVHSLTHRVGIGTGLPFGLGIEKWRFYIDAFAKTLHSQMSIGMNATA